MDRRVSATVLLAMVMLVGMEGWRNAEAISCGQVVVALSPCINYARVGGTVPRSCCNGVRQVVAASKANKDLQISCGCIKQMASSIPGVKYELINTIPGKCGVSLPWELSPSLDCSKVHW